MHKEKTYKILYYLCFVLSLILFVISCLVNPNLNGIYDLTNLILFIISLILFIAVTISLKKKRKLNNITIIFPIIYLVFLIFVVAITIINLLKLFFLALSIYYYITFVLFNYLLLNIYTVLSIRND